MFLMGPKQLAAQAAIPESCAGGAGKIQMK